MDLKTIFTKTAKGVTQVNQKTQSLSRGLMKVLKVIDVLERVGNGELVITYEDHRPVAVVDTSTGEVES